MSCFSNGCGNSGCNSGNNGCSCGCGSNSGCSNSNSCSNSSCGNNSCGSNSSSCWGCQRGPRGPQGIPGPQGPQGPQGIAGGLLSYANFYDLVGAGVAEEVVSGSNVAFPRTSAISGTSISRINDSTFNLANAGNYAVFFNVPMRREGRLVLTLNGVELPYTAVENGDEDRQLTGMAIIPVTVANSVLALKRTTNNAADANYPRETVAASLMIMQLG